MENLKKIKYAYFDLDGTTLNSKEVISEKTKKVFRILRKNNIKYGLATGRAHFVCYGINNDLKPDLPFVGMNGLLTYDFTKNKIFYKKTMEENIAKDIMKFLYENKITFFAYNENKILCFQNKNEDNEFIKNRDKWNKTQPKKYQYESRKWELKDLDSYEEVFKIIIFTNKISKNNIINIKKNVEDTKGIYWLNSQDFLLEIMPFNESKGSTLEKIALNQTINLDETIVFGDSNNDIEMFQVAKVAVAMENSTKEIKELSTHSTLSNDKDGIYEFVTKIWGLK